MARRTALLFVVLLFCFVYYATCNILLDVPEANTCADRATYSWMYNSMNQSPCEVAYSLVGLCNLTQSWSDCGLVYCCTVTYSLYSACLICNGEPTESWPTYYNNAGCAKSCGGLAGPGISPWASVPLLVSLAHTMLIRTVQFE
ncbi:hypothetical protein C8Q73DRAFT_694648 [Cubamyces lactineus]|nr:hypothetical protein C8Q73DRAFT_694648 [Cubamyces lactineus]